MREYARAKLAGCCLLLLLVLPSGAAAEDAPLLILLTNDDGYDAPGLQEMARALAPLGQLLVAAPADNQSGTGHGTTGRQFIQVREVEIVPGIPGYAIAARPATCVRLGMEALAPRKPDLVVSGINRGTNLGIVVNYSGTVGAAREGAIAGAAAIAVSMTRNATREDYAAIADYVRQLVQQLRAEGRLRPGLFLNINAPSGKPAGVRVVRQSTAATPEFFMRYEPRDDRLYFWSDYGEVAEVEEGTDVWAVQNGFLAITPLELDQTSTSDLDWLKEAVAKPAPAAAQR
jgi:5'-nucleotidase